MSWTNSLNSWQWILLLLWPVKQWDTKIIFAEFFIPLPLLSLSKSLLFPTSIFTNAWLDHYTDWDHQSFTESLVSLVLLFLPKAYSYRWRLEGRLASKITVWHLCGETGGVCQRNPNWLETINSLWYKKQHQKVTSPWAKDNGGNFSNTCIKPQKGLKDEKRCLHAWNQDQGFLSCLILPRDTCSTGAPPWLNCSRPHQS